MLRAFGLISYADCSKRSVSKKLPSGQDICKDVRDIPRQPEVENVAGQLGCPDGLEIEGETRGCGMGSHEGGRCCRWQRVRRRLLSLSGR